MNDSNSEELVLVDGSGYIFRAYYALPPMNRSDGLPVNAIFGFCNMLLKLIDDGGLLFNFQNVDFYLMLQFDNLALVLNYLLIAIDHQ